jgi:hypothetical protein
VAAWQLSSVQVGAIERGGGGESKEGRGLTFGDQEEVGQGRVGASAEEMAGG